jgi:hypothetical protein
MHVLIAAHEGTNPSRAATPTTLAAGLALAATHEGRRHQEGRRGPAQPVVVALLPHVSVALLEPRRWGLAPSAPLWDWSTTSAASA